MAAVQEPLQVPRPIPRHEDPSGFLALIGASLLVLSVVVRPPVHAGCALAGFLLWLLGMPRLLLFGRIGFGLPMSPAELAATTAKPAVQKVKRLFFGRQAPPPPPPEPAAAQA